MAVARLRSHHQTLSPSLAPCSQRLGVMAPVLVVAEGPRSSRICLPGDDLMDQGQ